MTQTPDDIQQERKSRDILDVNAPKAANTPTANVSRPVVDQSFLTSFLNESKGETVAEAERVPGAAPESVAATSAADSESLADAVVEMLRSIYDPEIPVNIYDMGLIYEVEVSASAHAVITMTLTTPHCPVAETMPGEVEMRVASVPGIMSSEVKLVWDPPWDMSRMSDEARLELGLL